MSHYQVILKKMRTVHQKPVHYFLQTEQGELCLNDCIGSVWRLRYTQQITCVHCQRRIHKSFQQGYCFPCFRSLAECDSCLMNPEKCHYHLGTCREPVWGETHCFQPHFVYLANSSGLKVGITRMSNTPFRWMDQGAVQALPIYRVDNRLQSGLLEVAFKQLLPDKTHWQKMLKGEHALLDLCYEREALLPALEKALSLIQVENLQASVEYLSAETPLDFEYPGEYSLSKIHSIDLEKTAYFEGQLLGIKGQYLIFDVGVFNVRKFSGYTVEVEMSAV